MDQSGSNNGLYMNYSDTENSGWQTLSNPTSWHHTVAAWDVAADIFYWYLDGELIYSDETLTPFASTATSVVLGGNIEGETDLSGSNFMGVIDEVKFFNFLLSPEQVRQEYNLGSQTSLGKQKESSEAWDAGGFGGNAPVGYWNFEEGSGSTVYDRSANSNNGTITAATYTLGKPGWGLSYDGTDDYVSVSYNAAFSPTTAVTVEAWVKMDDPTANARIVSKTEGSGYTLGTTIDSVADQNFFVYRNGGYGKVGWSNTNFSSNTWYHLVGTYDGRYTKFYVNGQLKDTDDAGATYPIVEISNNLCFGIEAGVSTCTTSSDFSGKIDEIRIFDYARSQAQIAFDYNGGKPVMWLPFDENEGIIVKDISGNGNDGTMTSMDPATDWVDGIREYALDFDSTNDYITLPNDIGYNDQVSAFAWFKSEGTPTGGYHIVFGGSELEISVPTAGALRTGVYTTSRYVHDNGSGLTDGDWHHIGFTFNGSVKIAYIDGKDVGQNSGITGSLTSSFANRTIGRFGSSTGYYMNGLIDDVRVYNYVLTPDQVKEVMNGGSINIR